MQTSSIDFLTTIPSFLEKTAILMLISIFLVYFYFVVQVSPDSITKIQLSSLANALTQTKGILKLTFLRKTIDFRRRYMAKAGHTEAMGRTSVHGTYAFDEN